MNPFPAILNHFVGAPGTRSTEDLRRARLLAGFGLLGAVFGSVYALFYLLIAHNWGAGVIIVCSAAFATIPWLVRWGLSLALLGHLFGVILVAGFSGLCCVEGGLHGHAIAWLASIPLYALLLVGLRGATVWGTLCLASASLIAGCELAGIALPNLCPEEWRDVVSAAGYFGLTLFMLMLGIIFERGRSLAATSTQAALDQLSAANERLKQLNREKNEFLSIAVHDLKNPLTVVMGMSDLLGSGLVPPDKVAATSRKISDQAIRMRELISNLLDLNAIEEGRMTLARKSLDVAQLCTTSVEGFTELARRKNIALQLQNAAVEARAVGDGQAILQILDNLISNAVKYSSPGSNVQVQLIHEQDALLVEVRDHGPGISQADQAKLFRRFVRLSTKPTGGESSNGLGLFIVKRLAEGMGGTIECHSEVGVGTSFVLSLPKETSPAAAPATKVEPVRASRPARFDHEELPVDLTDPQGCSTVGA